MSENCADAIRPAYPASGTRGQIPLRARHPPPHGSAHRSAIAFDLYAPEFAPGQVIAERRDLPYRHHMLDVSVTGRHDPKSSGSQVAIDGVQVHFR